MAAAAPHAEAEKCCCHGISQEDCTDKIFTAMAAALEDTEIIYNAFVESTTPLPPRQLIKKAQARIRKQHSRYITADGKSMLLAYMHSQAAQAILSDKLEDARHFCVNAFKFQHVVWRDKPIPHYENLYIADQIQNDRGAISYVAKKIPCDCLDAKVKEIKANSIKTSFCSECTKEVPFSSMMQCSRCKFHYVCSQECYEAGWAVHKPHCRNIIGLVKEREEMVEEAMAKTKAEAANLKGNKAKRGKK